MTLQTDDPADAEETPAADELPAPMTIEGAPVAVPIDGPWFRPDEPTLWAERFQHYLLAGPSRSILATYNGIGRDTELYGLAKTLPGSWFRHTQAWSWVARAALFDDHLRASQRSVFEVAYREQLAAHKRRAQQLATVSFGNTIALLAIVEKRLASLKPEELNAFALMRAMRAASQLGETALNAEAHTLALGDMMAGLEQPDVNKLSSEE